MQLAGQLLSTIFCQKKFYISGNRTFYPPPSPSKEKKEKKRKKEKLNKTFFHTLNKRNWETDCLSNLYYLLAARSGIQFLNCPPLPPSFSKTFSQNIFRTLPLTVQYLYDLQDAMPRYYSPGTSLPTLPKEAEDFSVGGKYPDVSLPTFLAYMQPV